MDLFSLRCFVEVVRSGGFSRAADRVGRSQPAVSAQVKSLEELAGGPLFDRSATRPTLTARGRTLLPRAEKLVADFDALVQVIGGDGEPSGTVTLAAGQTIIDHLLPGVLGAFRSLHPGVRFRLLNRNFAGIDRALGSGEADLALGGFRAIPDRWEARLLGPCRYVAVVRKAGRQVPPVEAVLAGPQVTFEAGNETRQWLEGHLGPASSVLELTGTESILRYVDRGFGAAVVPYYCLSARRRARLAVVDLGDRLPPMEMALVTRQGAELSPAARLAAEMLGNRLPRLLG